jgi:DNA-binding MarR family transcriptional regulator
METKSTKYQIIWHIRRLFRALGQKESEALKEQNITLPQRAAMEFLYPDSELSVPQIAEKYQVSRQHIQSTINSLAASGFVASKRNANHKRSDLYFLTEKGKTLFADILSRDETLLNMLFSELPEEDIKTTNRTLLSLLDELQGG